MVIGISGKIESGKDLAGVYLQHILGEMYDNMMNRTGGEIDMDQIDMWEDDYEVFREEQSNWEITKFGGPLKDVVCILLGCTREDLEDRDFKDKILGEEWHIGNYKPTVRELLQKMGTEAGREQIHPNIWVNALMKDYTSITKREFHDDKWVREDNIIYPNWIITDVRFPNEVEAIKKRGGVVIRINREVERDNHASEIMLDDYKFDYVIENNGTKEELYRSLVDIYSKLVNDTVVV
jgi:hypothetical protein